MILNNACNPTGALYSKEELEALLKVAADADLAVISDEVYSGIVYDEKQFISCGAFPKHKERILVVQICK
ncbi:MAG TPA: aminotransferase class I/II-fold pyridoxal phosphate-dependent enzyme [Rhabdochlamydiaceae bacterium]|nr:aminotransferase class I/II-fold pyridoxal phosphate-dependent enzyme [Rhabdochlamydiaceae bacterium]